MPSNALKYDALPLPPVIFASIMLDGFLIDVQEEALLLTRNSDIDTKLLKEDLVQAGAVSVVDPVAHSSTFLLILTLSKEAPVVTLGTRDG